MGAYAQIALLGDWADNGAPFKAKAILKRLHDSIESALQEAARRTATD